MGFTITTSTGNSFTQVFESEVLAVDSRPIADFEPGLAWASTNPEQSLSKSVRMKSHKQLVERKYGTYIVLTKCI